MAGKRLEMRRQAEAAEAMEKDDDDDDDVEVKKPKRKAAPRKVKEKPVQRRRAVWIIYSSSMREEGRYPYDRKADAEARLEALRLRGKRLYWLQMVKEPIIDGQEVVTVEPALEDEVSESVLDEEAAPEEGDALEGALEGADFGDEEAEEEEEEEGEEEEEAAPAEEE